MHFNTPLSDGQEGTLTVESPEQCKLEVYEDRTVELLSGFKSKQEVRRQNRRPMSGHFVVAKDYYAAIKQGYNGYDECESGGHHTEKTYCYEPLGSLTTITGNDFPALGGAVIGQITIEPNAIRAPHWHLQFAEVGYCYEGIGQVGVIVPSNTIPKSADSQEFYEEKITDEIFVKEDEVFLFPQGSQHYLRNIGTEAFKCTLFFTEGTPLDGNQLLTISLQNIVGNTPLGVLNPVFVGKGNSVIENISESPAQKFTSVDQGPDVIKVVEACRGEKPDISDPGCSTKSERNTRF
ncbi:MAG: cupin domain-containing protein [Okeania sp. SIO2H7]|nr:cupin domain-containing protein [Okeania sp. SIO2H7]